MFTENSKDCKDWGSYGQSSKWIWFFCVPMLCATLKTSKRGDTIWRSIKSTNSIGILALRNGFTDAIYQKGQVYTLHETGKIATFDLNAPAEMTELLASEGKPLNEQY
ncbi:hypothetical protein V6N12_038645 [Hibiscus sabdariffa]|uniref:KIB1-4 beta-propeller domain-containing protein n=1 Tax=Hibiscus sabdariffa TaxID=183260 RepID=A0ABR2CAT3_9ROSI